jgi:deazaflavin-dependent oxidoreductase (nitroreductase family)
MTKQATTGARAQTLTAQRLVNRLVRGLLRTPLLSRAIGKRLITIYVVGRKTGRRYTLPVAYTRQDEVLLIGSPFGWIRNLRTGEQVDVRLQGKRLPADVEVIADQAGVVDAYAAMSRDNHNFAKFNQIGLDAAGNPDPADLHLSWTAGARAVRLMPHYSAGYAVSDRDSFDHPQDPTVAVRASADRSTNDTMNLS